MRYTQTLRLSLHGTLDDFQGLHRLVEKWTRTLYTSPPLVLADQDVFGTSKFARETWALAFTTVLPLGSDPRETRVVPRALGDFTLDWAANASGPTRPFDFTLEYWTP